MTPFYSLVLGTLCVWRLTHLLQAEDGPGDILVRFRRALGDGFWGSLMDCFYCLSLWIAAPFAYWLGQSLEERLLLWPALSAAAILLERATNPSAGVASPAPYFFDDEENEDAMLRPEETGDVEGKST